MNKNQCDILVIIPLQEENDIFLSTIGTEYNITPKNIDINNQDLIGYRYKYNGKNIIVFCLVKMGLVKTAISTFILQKEYTPTVSILLGIGGAIDKDVDLGDVVVATKVHHYLHEARVEDDGKHFTFNLQGESYSVSHKLEQIITATKTILKNKMQCNLHIGEIASGDIVCVSNNFKNLLLQKVARKLLALEMEGFGAMTALKYPQGTNKDIIIIRGISDLCDKKKDIGNKKTNKKTGVYREYAVNMATLYLHNLIDTDKFTKLYNLKKTQIKNIKISSKNKLIKDILNAIQSKDDSAKNKLKEEITEKEISLAKKDRKLTIQLARLYRHTNSLDQAIYILKNYLEGKNIELLKCNKEIINYADVFYNFTCYEYLKLQLEKISKIKYNKKLKEIKSNLLKSFDLNKKNKDYFYIDEDFSESLKLDIDKSINI